MNYFIKKIGLKFPDIFISLIFILLSGISIYIYLKAGFSLFDFEGNRVLSKYVLNGIDPLKYLGKPAPYESIEAVPYAYGGLPYGLLLGNLMYFGFLDHDAALLCYRIETFVLIILTIYVAIKFFKKYYGELSDKLIYYFVIFTVFSISLVGSLNVGNIGHIICMLVLISIFTARDNVIVSSICIALAMVKPQITFPFCICFLFCKKFLNVFIAATIDVIATVVCACMVNENVFIMFREFFDAKVGSNYTSYGFLSIFYCKSQNYYAALIPSMILGIIILCIVLFNLKYKDNYLITFSFAAFVANIWSYTWSSDYYILILPAMAFIYLYLNNQNKNYIHSHFMNVVFVIFALSLLLIWPIKHVLKHYFILNKYLAKVLNIGWYNNIFSNTYVYIFVLMVMFFMLIFYNAYYSKIETKIN